MKSISKYEAIGIFGSVMAMVLVLAVIRFGFGGETSEPIAEAQSKNGIVLVDEGDADKSQALANALLDAATVSGELKRLVIDDVEIGEGETVSAGDTVVVHYIGSTRDGVQFDSSYLSGKPFEFTLGEGKVIDGWEQGIIGMNVGGQRMLIIPPELGYGNRQVGPIAPNSVLVFAVELLEIRE